MAIKMIALDLDGTTLNSSGHVSEYTKKVLAEAADKGVTVVVSTGRVYTSVPEEVQALEMVDYIISSNGAVIFDKANKEIIYGNYVSPKAALEAIDIAKRNDIWIEAFWDGKAFIDSEVYAHIEKYGLEKRNTKYVLSTRTPIDNLHNKMQDNNTIIENINFFFESMEKLESVKSEIYALDEATVTSSFRSNIEVGGATTSKRHALEALIETKHIAREELMCFGDAANDIEMIKFAGIGVAMGNAWDETKAAADYVTQTNDEDGVARAIEKFVL